MLISAYGSTETTSGCLAIHFETDKVGLGVPMPGIRVKLVPVDDALRSADRRPGRDAVLPARSAAHGREPRRGRLLPHGRPRGVPRSAAARARAGVRRAASRRNSSSAAAPGLAAGNCAPSCCAGSRRWSTSSFFAAKGIRALACLHGRTARRWKAQASRACTAAIRERLAAHNAANPGASTSVRRVLLLQEPPNAGAHELSDKGTVNRSAVLAAPRSGRRAALRRVRQTRCKDVISRIFRLRSGFLRRGSHDGNRELGSARHRRQSRHRRGIRARIRRCRCEVASMSARDRLDGAAHLVAEAPDRVVAVELDVADRSIDQARRARMPGRHDPREQRRAVPASRRC